MAMQFKKNIFEIFGPFENIILYDYQICPGVYIILPIPDIHSCV